MVAAVEQRDLDGRAGQGLGGGEAGEAATDDHDVRRHAPILQARGRGRGSRGILRPMPVIESHVDTGVGGVPREPRPHGRPGGRPARAPGPRRGGRRRGGRAAPPRAGQAASSASASSGCSTAARRSWRSGPWPRHGLYDGAAPAAGLVTGIGRVQRPRGHGGGQRRHREGRDLLPAHREEAPARAGDRRGEPPALRLPRRLGRGLPAAPGRGLPRPRPLRPHLLQRGAHERAGHPPDQRGARLLHGGRGLRAGHERRGGDREGPRARSSWAARRW